MRKLLATTALVTAVSFGLTATGPGPARAQVTVVDPGAIAQAIRQVSQQLQQIQQLQTQLSNEAAMLQKLETNVTGPLAAITSQATQLLQQAQGIGYNSQNIAAQYEQLYPANMQGLTFVQTSQALTSWQANSRQTLEEAMATQNQIALNFQTISSSIIAYNLFSAYSAMETDNFRSVWQIRFQASA